MGAETVKLRENKALLGHSLLLIPGLIGSARSAYCGTRASYFPFFLDLTDPNPVLLLATGVKDLGLYSQDY
jgi:hypothetical protein